MFLAALYRMARKRERVREKLMGERERNRKRESARERGRCVTDSSL